MSSSPSDIPLLNPRAIFGLKTDVPGNVDCITDDEIVYPVGGVLTVQNANQRRQKFIRLPQRGANVTGMFVSPNKKLIAVSERGTRPTITLFDAQTYKKKRQIQIPPERDVSATEFIAICFTFDSKSLVTVTGDPDWDLYVFRCERGKIDSSTRALNPNGTGTVAIIACNPNDVNLVVLAGNQLLRILACSELVWRQFGYSKAENVNFTACAWLSQDRLFVGTNEGRVLIIENGELKAVFWAGDMTMLTLKTKDEQRASQTSLSMLSTVAMREGEDNEIRSVITFGRGFAFAYLTGTIHLYEKVTPHKYTKRNVFKIPAVPVKSKFSDEEEVVTNNINCIRITPSEDRLIITCSQTQIYTTKLWGRDLTMIPEMECVPLGPSLHYGRIGGVSICMWKPLFMTSGLDDRSLRIWNYEQESLEVCKEFQEDIYGISIHPTGLFAVVGFSDKLRFLTITIDDLIRTREFHIRSCKLCSFSKLGHLFAATNGNVIQVYSTVSFEQLFVLKGHSSVITSMSWSRDDNRLATCGHDGAVYEWEVSTTERVSEVIIKSCQFTSAAITSDGETIYAVGTDGYLRDMKKGSVERELMFLGNGVDCLVLSNSDMMLFASGNEGTVYSIKLPFLDTIKYLEFPIHCSDVYHMQISYDDKYLISCSVTGVICIWRLVNIEGKGVKLSKDFHHTSEILISRQDLYDKIMEIRDLKLRMHELQTEHAYQMRQNDVVHNLRMKDVHEGYFNAIEELKEKNEQMEADHIQEINNINVDIANMKAAHEEFVQKLEFNYNEKLINEYDKYLRLEEKMDKMRLKYEKELNDLANAKKESEQKITNNFLDQLRQKQVQLEELLEKAQKTGQEQELIKQQIEDDADREIYELKTAHEQELKEEQDANVRLRAETGIIKKKFISAQKEIDDLKHTVFAMENEHVKFKGVIIELEKDVSDLKKEIAERDNTIQDKERRIFELKSKNQELEKFKFILDFKIKELQSQIEPRERTIREQTEQINDMVRELENLQRIVINLDLQLAELREKLASADNELKKEVSKNRAMKAALKKIRIDIHQASGLVQDVPKLTKALKEMYHKYNADRDFAATQAEDVEAKNEFLRQRDFLERTVKTLKQQVNKSSVTGGTDKIRLVEENAALITETNILRTDLKVQQRENRKMQSVLGLGNKFMLPKDAQKKLDEAIATKEDIHKKYKEKLKDRESRINALKDENKRLISKITDGSEDVQSQTEKPSQIRSKRGGESDRSH